MPNKDPNNSDLMTVVCLIFFALVGAVAREAHRYLVGDKVGVKILACKAIIAVFGAWLSVLLCRHFEFSDNFTGIVCGLAGWLGADFIQVIADKAKDKVDKQ